MTRRRKSMGRRGLRRNRAATRLLGQRTGLQYEEVFTFSVTVGLSTTVTRDTLASLPAATAFRPMRWIVESLQAYVPATTTLPGYYCPAAIQCAILEGTAESQQSPLRLCASAITRIVVVPRPDYPWFDPGIAGTVGLLRISAVCIGPPASGVTSFLRGVVRCIVGLQPETSATSCPTLLDDDILRVA